MDIDTSYYSYYSNNIFVYHENLGSNTNPQFSLGVKNPFNLTSPQNFSLYGSLLSHNLIDLDNDGDYDLLATYSGIYQNYSYGTYSYDQSAHTVFKYYENIGNPTIPLFAAQQTNPFGLELDSVIGISEVVDIDGVRILFEGGWGLLRASNTQPVLVARFEAESSDQLNKIRQEIEGWLFNQGVTVE